METSLPARLHIVAWPDPVIDRLGFPPQSPYTELCWLPRLGPSATLAYRRLAGTLAQRPDGFDIDVAELAQCLGLGRGTGAQSPLSRTLRRLVGFDLARFADERTYALRRRIPPLSCGQLRHLSAELQRIHHALLERHQAEIASVGPAEGCRGIGRILRSSEEGPAPAGPFGACTREAGAALRRQR